MPILTPNGTVSSEEMRKAAQEEKAMSFARDIQDVYKKHKMMFRAIIRTSPDTIKAVLDIVEITPEMEEELNKV